MREDHLTDAGSMELAWMREDGCGPDLVNVKAVVFLYDQPGPRAHVGLHVEGRGGPSLPVETTRELAALLLKAAGIAERDGAPAPVATHDELVTYDWFCSYCGEKVDEQTRGAHVRACPKHPLGRFAIRVREAARVLGIVVGEAPLGDRVERLGVSMALGDLISALAELDREPPHA